MTAKIQTGIVCGKPALVKPLPLARSAAGADPSGRRVSAATLLARGFGLNPHSILLT